MNLAGKVSIITGGAQGLGKLFSECLLKRGAKVCIADVNQKKGEVTVKDFGERFGHGRALFVKCDVTSSTELENAFQRTKEEFGGIDIVCNNAGIGDERKWELMIQINLIAVIRGTQLGIKYLRKDQGGNGGLIVNVASTAGLMAVDFIPAYVASKTGVVAYTRSVAESRENKRNGIRLCTLCPSFTDTDIIKGTEDNMSLDHPRFLEALKYIGIMRPETVGEAFMQLVDEEDNNGAVMAVTKYKGIQYIPPPANL